MLDKTLDAWEFRAILKNEKALNPLRLKASEMAPHCINCPNTQRYISSPVSSLALLADNFIFPCNYKKSCYNAIKSLQLYILFLVALGLTESCFYTILPASAKCCFTVRFIALTSSLHLIKSNCEKKF